MFKYTYLLHKDPESNGYFFARKRKGSKSKAFNDIANGYSILMQMHYDWKISSTNCLILIKELLKLPLPMSSVDASLQVLINIQIYFLDEIKDVCQDLLMDSVFETCEDLPTFVFHEELGYGQFFFLYDEDNEDTDEIEYTSCKIYSQYQGYNWIRTYGKEEFKLSIIDCIKLERKLEQSEECPKYLPETEVLLN